MLKDFEALAHTNPAKTSFSIFFRSGTDGHACLLRSICEASESPLAHNGLIGELLQLFLT
jgi:hypothetical protein